MTNIACVVPVRKGSERVKNKNTRTFGDTTLLDKKLSILKTVPDIDIFVNTDCDEAKKIARKYDVFIHDREKYYASSECSNADFFKHIAENVPGHYEHVMYCPVTSPFISYSTVCQVLKTYKNDIDHDSIITCNVIKQPLWMNEHPLNYSIDQVLKSQDLPNVLAINFGVAILPRNLQIEKSNVYGNNPLLFPINDYEAIDIDTLFDFEIAQMIYRQLF